MWNGAYPCTVVISKLLKWILKATGVISCLPIFPFKGQRACFWPKWSFVKSLIRMILFFHAFILRWLKILLFLHLLFFFFTSACSCCQSPHSQLWQHNIWPRIFHLDSQRQSVTGYCFLNVNEILASCLSDLLLCNLPPLHCYHYLLQFPSGTSWLYFTTTSIWTPRDPILSAVYMGPCLWLLFFNI